MPLHLTHGGAVGLMVAVTLMWGTAGMVTRHLEGAHSFEITFWRGLFTVLSLCAILPLWRGPKVFRALLAGGRELWISGLCWAVMFTAFMVALTLASTASVLVTMSLGPLLTALAARLFIGHRLPARTWLAIVVAGLGIGWMYGAQLLGGAGGSLLGTLVALCVPLAGAANWTVVQHAQARGQRIDLVPAVLIGAVLCTLATLPLAMPFRASAHDLGLLAFLGLFQLAIPCVLSVLCASVLKAPEVALLALLEVIFGIALAWLGANERPAPSVLTGGAMVIGALLFNELLALRGRRTTVADQAVPGAH
ncbi:DMT family transporter [Variovorax paradoxus]|uniref:DMT family transporter n=1 Tax=Variovorax paradoxus TaxID=34073 RepID=UPI001ABC92D8